MMPFEAQYAKMLLELQRAKTVKARGIIARELLYKSFEIDPADCIINFEPFKTNLAYAKLELKWYLAASNRIDFDERICKTWGRFSDDGATVNSAYGHRIFGFHRHAAVDQWEWVKKKLRQDQDSRQCVINLNFPSDKYIKTKDFVCTMYCHLFLRDGKLHWSTHLRSQDIYYGTRNDVYCFASMQQLMAKELGVMCGVYRHFMDSVHAYENTLKKIDEESLVEIMKGELYG